MDEPRRLVDDPNGSALVRRRERVRRAVDATRSAVPSKNCFSLPASISARRRAATTNTSCAASSAASSGTPRRRTDRHTKS